MLGSPTVQIGMPNHQPAQAPSADVLTARWCDQAQQLSTRVNGKPTWIVAVFLLESTLFVILVEFLLWVIRAVESRLNNSHDAVASTARGSHTATAIAAVVCLAIAEAGKIANLLVWQYADIRCLFETISS